MVLGITNYLNEDIENVNIQIEKLIDKIGEEKLHIFIFHDNNYEQSYHKYESFKNLTILTENKNKGTLYGRVQVIKMIPEEFNDEFLIWLDADDELNVDLLLSLIEKYKTYDYVTRGMEIKCVWTKLVKIGAYKQAIKKIKLYPNLRMRVAECNILTAALLDLCYKGNISYISDFFLNWIGYSGQHQSFDIRINFDECRKENLKADLEEMIQWFIWKEIDKLDFDISIEGCDSVYLDNLKRIKRIYDKKTIFKINNLIEEIIKDMPYNYKSIIRSKLIIR